MRRPSARTGARRREATTPKTSRGRVGRSSTARSRGAAAEDRLERALAVRPPQLEDRHVEQGAAVEDRCADELGVLREEVLRRRGAVRAAEEVHALVAERDEHGRESSIAGAVVYWRGSAFSFAKQACA